MMLLQKKEKITTKTDKQNSYEEVAVNFTVVILCC